MSTFSGSYRIARSRFLAAARDARLSVTSYLHPLKGREGEDLALDLALDGDRAAAKLLIVSSACHGVEGYCGSAVQLNALQTEGFRAQAAKAGVAVLYAHALNPYGFSHLRRTTHENVDLNRNFPDFSQPLPANPEYGELHDLLLPKEWPPDAANQAALGQYIASRGMPALQRAVSGGQYQFEDGLFYGGTAPTWSHTVTRLMLREFAACAQQVAWIDLHTGLGPTGFGERIFSGRDNDLAAFERAKQWWGNGGQSKITRAVDGTTASSQLTGVMAELPYQEYPQAQSTRLVIEFGTKPGLEVLQALRAEQWLQNHPQTAPELAARIKRQMLEAFFVDSDEWRRQILSQAHQAIEQAVAGLSASS